MHFKFPSIEAFRNVCFKIRRSVQGDDGTGNPINPDLPLPVLTYRGTTKLHGTNASVVFNALTSELSYQSRDRLLTLDDDLFGFMAHMTQREPRIHELMHQYMEIAVMAFDRAPSRVVVFGEWAGGSIQKRDIAIRNVEKFWAVVGVRVYFGDPGDSESPEESFWLDYNDLRYVHDMEHRIFHISKFGTWSVDVDFNRANEAEKLIDEATQRIDTCCPAGAYFGVEGHGEGLVWECTTPGYTPNDWSAKYPGSSSFDLSFKSKGEKHETSKKKEMDNIDPEHEKKVQLFVIYAVSENRMQQGLDKLTRDINQPLTLKLLGPFIKWVYDDVIKEELDVALINNITAKELGRPVAEMAKAWFFEQLEQAK